jgi:hypothetical protein
VHTKSLQEKFTFVLSAILYIVFNLRPGTDFATTIKATLWQLLQTAPYVVGISYMIIVLLQYMADGDKVPWNRRFRLFFAVGIIAGLLQAIYEYAGVGVTPQ